MSLFGLWEKNLPIIKTQNWQITKYGAASLKAFHSEVHPWEEHSHMLALRFHLQELEAAVTLFICLVS